MDSIQILVEKINEAAKWSKIIVEEVEQKYRAGSEMRKNQSVELLKTLRTQYGDGIAKVIEPVFTNETIKGTLEFESNQFYRDMASSIPGFINNRIDPSNISNLRTFLLEKAMEMGIVEFQSLDFGPLFAKVSTLEQLPSQLEALFVNSKQEFFGRNYLKKIILDKLYENRYSVETLPVIVIKGVKDNEAKVIAGLFSGVFHTEIPVKSNSNVVENVAETSVQNGPKKQDQRKKGKS